MLYLILLFLVTCRICVILFKICLIMFKKTFLEQRCGSNSYSKYVHMLTRGRGVEKLVLRYIPTKWMAPSKCCRIPFCALVQPSTLKHQGKENAVVFFHHKIILSYAIIYAILHIYLQASETEMLAELHWVIGLSVLEKINSIYFQGISLALSRMYFQESKCAFKNPNVLNIEAS